jgi:hypothetical protein
MLGWWVLMGAVIAAGTAFVPKTLRRHRRRDQVDRVRAALSTWLPALNQPDDRGLLSDGGGVPPTSCSVVSPPRGVVRCRRTVMFGVLVPNIAVPSSNREGHQHG